MWRRPSRGWSCVSERSRSEPRGHVDLDVLERHRLGGSRGHGVDEAIAVGLREALKVAGERYDPQELALLAGMDGRAVDVERDVAESGFLHRGHHGLGRGKVPRLA